MSDLDARKLKKELSGLTNAVRSFPNLIDAEMKRPSTEERGREIARLCNGLEMANDRVRFFVLGEDYRAKARGGVR